MGRLLFHNLYTSTKCFTNPSEYVNTDIIGSTLNLSDICIANTTHVSKLASCQPAFVSKGSYLLPYLLSFCHRM